MAENGNGAQTNGDANAAGQAPQVRMRILNQYIRDLSFENILAQKGGGGNVVPDVQVQVNLDARKREQEHQYEVVIKLKVDSSAKDGDQKIFLLEIEYAGLFEIQNVPDEQLHAFLLIECPRMIFPFLRRVVSDVSRDGGYPPLNLENIDFLQLYRMEVERRQAAAQAADTAPAG